jgi:hypothetical protein
MAKNFDELEHRLQNELAKAAKERGIDTAQMKDTTVHVEQDGGHLHVTWGEIEVKVPVPSLPAPSPQTTDTLWAILVGSLVTLASVTVGVGLAIATGGGTPPPQPPRN